MFFQLAGQPLGGVLFAASHMLPFVVDAASFVLSFLAVLFVRRPLQGARLPSRRSLLGDIAEGLTWLWHQHFLRAVAVLIGATNIVLNALLLVLIVRAQGMGATPATIGLLLAFSGVAAILSPPGPPGRSTQSNGN